MPKVGTKRRKAENDSGATYTAQRGALESQPRQRQGRRADPRHARSICEDESETWGEKVPTKILSAKDAKDFRAEMTRRFQLPPRWAFFLTDERNFLEQQGGSCSFAGLLQLLHMTEVLESLDEVVPPKFQTQEKRWAWWQSHWISHWQRILKANGGKEANVPDVASTLDLLPLAQKFAPPGFKYIPIRSAGNSEMSFNESFWVPQDEAAAAFGVDGRAYREMPWTYQTALLMEAAIARGLPVAINSDSHTRVAIACDATHLLCVDSYGPRHQEGHSERFWKAGLSVVEKWRVYNFVREVMIVECGVTGGQQAAAQAGEGPPEGSSGGLPEGSTSGRRPKKKQRTAAPPGSVRAGGKAASEGPDVLRCGQAVVVQGVRSKPALNGRFGKLQQYDATTGRWEVELSAGERFSLQPANLTARVDFEAGEAADSDGAGSEGSLDEDMPLATLQRAASKRRAPVEINLVSSSDESI